MLGVAFQTRKESEVEQNLNLLTIDFDDEPSAQGNRKRAVGSFTACLAGVPGSRHWSALCGW